MRGPGSGGAPRGGAAAPAALGLSWPMDSRRDPADHASKTITQPRETTMTVAARVVLCTLLAMTAVTALTPPASAQSITISEGLYLGWAPFYVADARNLWARHGLTVTAVPFTSGRLALDAIVGGRAAFGTVAETPVVFAALNGLPVRIIAHMNTHEVFDLVARTGLKSIADVKGRRVGYLQGTNAQYYLHRMLERAGLKPDQITAISMNPPDMVTSLTKGDIDAFIWAEPYISQAVALGKGGVHVIRTPGLYRSYSSIVTLQSTIDTQPAMLVKGLRAAIDAVELIRANPEEAIALAAEKTKMDPAIAARAWKEIHYGIELHPGIVADMEAQARWAIDSGLARQGTRMPDFSKIVVRELLEQARGK
jgi:NitT/TauT family transport system substrate-binding protein